jgi:predicted Zn-dependent protease
VQSIDTAIVLWNEAGGFGLTRDAKETLPRLRVQFEKALSSFRGVYDDERGVVIINERLDDPRALALTVAHELGHAFGLWHVASSSRTSLMNPGVVTVEPTPEDVNEVRAIWGSCGFTPESN